MIRVLFVCHGNICRSAMAEYMLKAKLGKLGYKAQVSSAAVSYEEEGNDLYGPAKRCLEKHGVPYQRHYAHRIQQDEYDAADEILCMDRGNLRLLAKAVNTAAHKEKLLLDREVDDPWYTGDYETTYCDLEEGIEKLIERIFEKGD